jgi:integrase
MAKIHANFSLKEPSSDSPTLIYLKSYYKGRRLVISTGLTIHPTHWDGRIQRPITTRLENLKKELRHSISSDIRTEKEELERLIRNIKKEISDFDQLMANVLRELNNFEKEFANAVQHLKNTNSLITVEKIKTIIESKLKPEKARKVDVKDFWSCFEEFLEVRKAVYAETTMKKYKTLKKRLLEFEKQHRYKISFESINLEFYDRYKAYLLKHKNPKKENKPGLLNDTISKEFAGLKAFMKWSLNRGYHSNDIFRSEEFSAKKKPKQDQLSLTMQEFNDICRVDLSKKPTLERVRDLFCFAVYTGQRWSEIEGFKKEQIQDESAKVQ